MSLQLGNVTFDCDDTLAVARFWSEALRRPIDQEATDFFATIGGPDATAVTWMFAKVPEDSLPQVRSQAWQVTAPP